MTVVRKSAFTASALAAGVAALLGATACGSSSPASSTGSSTSPVTVEMISQVTGSNFGSPETVTTAHAVVKVLNTEGGLGGHHINIITCDDKGDPTTAGNCAREAGSSHAVAVVEGVTVNGAVEDPIFQAEKIPALVSAVVPQDESNPYAYPTDGGGIALWGGSGALLVKSGCTKVAVVYDDSNPDGRTAVAAVSAGVTTAGNPAAKVVTSVGVSESSTDLNAAISQALGANPDCIAATLTPTLNVAAIKAVSASAKPNMPIAMIGPGLPLAVADQVGSIAKNVLIDSAQYLPGDPRCATYTSLMQTSHISPSSFSESVYVDLNILHEALAKHTGPLTASDVKAALDSTTGLHVECLPGPVQFHTPFSIPAYARVTDRSVAGYSFNGTSFVGLTGDRAVLNLTGALEKVAG